MMALTSSPLPSKQQEKEEIHGAKPFRRVCATREETRVALQDLISNPNDYCKGTFGDGPMLMSDVPASAIVGPVVVGIDEAGRGPALGPMVYAAAFWKDSEESNDGLPSGLTDSKVLTIATRATILAKLLESIHCGFVVRVLPASEISRNMLRHPSPYNLNAMSHDAAMAMIQTLLQQKVVISKCYVDTVGDPASYQRRLEQAFPAIQFCVEPKADANYPTCSAASVVAKVTRDEMLQNWKADGSIVDLNFGSGYPSDSKCVEWIARNLQDPVFGFSNSLVRFSWNPIKNTLKANKEVVEVTFAADAEDEDENSQQYVIMQNRMKAFLTGSQGPPKKKKRLPYFEKLGFHAVANVCEPQLEIF